MIERQLRETELTQPRWASHSHEDGEIWLTTECHITIVQIMKDNAKPLFVLRSQHADQVILTAMVIALQLCQLFLKKILLSKDGEKSKRLVKQTFEFKQGKLTIQTMKTNPRHFCSSYLVNEVYPAGTLSYIKYFFRLNCRKIRRYTV